MGLSWGFSRSVISSLRIWENKTNVQLELVYWLIWRPGGCFNIETVFPGIGIPIIKIRQSWDHSIFIPVMGIPKLATEHYTDTAPLGPASWRLMTSQFKDIVTHMQNYKTVKCIFCGVWVQNFGWNFKGALWNFTQNFEPIHRKRCILHGVKNLTTSDILELWHLKS